MRSSPSTCGRRERAAWRAVALGLLASAALAAGCARDDAHTAEPSPPPRSREPAPPEAVAAEGVSVTGGAPEAGSPALVAPEAAAPEAVSPEGAAPESPLPSPAIDARLRGLVHAPFDVPEGAPEALVHAPAGALDAPGPIHVVLFLHGYTGCVEVLASDAPDARCTDGERRGHAGFGVVRAHDSAEVGSVLVLPQLAWMTRDGSPGRFARPGEARAFLEEALLAAGIEREIGRVTLAAHSAAFETSIAIVRHGGLEPVLADVVLLDALYSGGPAFLGWARAGTDAAPRTLVSLHTGGGTTARRGEALARDARAALPDATLLDPADGLDALVTLRAPARVLVLRVPGAHGDVPRRTLGPALRALAPHVLHAAP